MEFDVKVLYQKLFVVANQFLKMADMMSIQELRDHHDPSVDSIAKLATMLSAIMNELTDDDYDDQRISINAAQCALYMKQIAIAVREDNEELLNKAVKDLEGLDLI